MNKSTEATPEDANHSLARRIGDEPQKFWDKVLWTDFMDQSDGKAKVWRKKDLLMIPNIQAHLKHSGGNVMAWAFVASSRTGSLIFINDVTHDGSSKINSEVYRNTEEETEGSNPPKLKEAAVKAWKSITKEECKSLVMSMGHRLDAVIESKGFATKY